MSEDNAAPRKTATAIIFLVFLFSLGFSLFINLPVMDQNFLFAD
ncbi:MAG: hypothetical protein H6P98_1648, partial [Candidatus Aminicenantes bacterium]|nr:hypothetical protein [Candidatus Aminicenantes bacterium]